MWDVLTENKARIINVASCAHMGMTVSNVTASVERVKGTITEQPGGATVNWSPYSESKAANVLFSDALAVYAAGTGVSVCSLHPGVLATGLWRDSPCACCFEIVFACKPVCQSGAFIAHLASSSKTFKNGGYYQQVRKIVMPDNSSSQQCLCCCSIPVSPSAPDVSSESMEKFWTTSCDVLEAKGYSEASASGRKLVLQQATFKTGLSCCGIGECLAAAPNFSCCLSALC